MQISLLMGGFIADAILRLLLHADIKQKRSRDGLEKWQRAEKDKMWKFLIFEEILLCFNWNFGEFNQKSRYNIIDRILCLYECYIAMKSDFKVLGKRKKLLFNFSTAHTWFFFYVISSFNIWRDFFDDNRIGT